MDDLILSHEDPEVVTEVINDLKELYERLPNGEIKEIVPQRGKVLDYLEIEFDFSVSGEVKISIDHHINKVQSMFPDKLRDKTLSSPNKPKLFEVRNVSEDFLTECE